MSTVTVNPTGTQMVSLFAGTRPQDHVAGLLHAVLATAVHNVAFACMAKNSRKIANNIRGLFIVEEGEANIDEIRNTATLVST